MGGARPKALVNIGGEQWVIKFADGDPADTPLIEHAAMTLAQQAAIRVAETLPVRLIHGHAVAIKRFDRAGGRRLHCLSARVALQAAAEGFGYPELAQLLRRRGVVDGDVYIAQMRELFRRMVFNILIDNTDDHEKNHALLVTDAQQYELSPAYDVLPSGQALGFQQMRVGDQEADATLVQRSVDVPDVLIVQGPGRQRDASGGPRRGWLERPFRSMRSHPCGPRAVRRSTSIVPSSRTSETTSAVSPRTV